MEPLCSTVSFVRFSSLTIFILSVFIVARKIIEMISIANQNSEENNWRFLFLD